MLQKFGDTQSVVDAQACPTWALQTDSEHRPLRQESSREQLEPMFRVAWHTKFVLQKFAVAQSSVAKQWSPCAMEPLCWGLQVPSEHRPLAQ